MDQPVKPAYDNLVRPAPTAKEKKSPRRRRGLVLLLIAALAGAVFWWASRPRPGPPSRPPQPMSIVPGPVTTGDVGINLNALGTVTSLATVTIKSQISGQLIRVVFTEGQEVKKGDLLAEIDPRPYEAALAQAKGQLARDQALLKGSQVDLARYQGLAAQNAVPRQTLDTQVAQVAQNEGTVAADRAAVQTAEVNLQYCRILSPVDGRVGLRQVDQGNYVTPGDTNGLVVITQLQPISVLFTLPEDNLQLVSKRLHEGATLPTAAYSRDGKTKLAEGTLNTFDSQIDPTTGTIKLRAQFNNEARTLFPNQFVNIRLLVNTLKNVTVMPTAGIQRGAPGTFAYLINPDDTVSVRKITLGVTDGDRAEVDSGLSPGDRVVIDGADRLRDGAKIIIRAEATKPAPPQATPASNSQNGQNNRPSK
ncbi:MAG TPA: MdtA/MuxA family multidrug efflux RND transporter periplasmic adaptor subunit [Xanthobacteraceae bacterium]|nr:MdtA/MuxA family multidrug efflux RND transporter periplasmic adaptor subunit [Xanthobacteraceae bacterium]